MVFAIYKFTKKNITITNNDKERNRLIVRELKKHFGDNTIKSCVYVDRTP